MGTLSTAAFWEATAERSVKTLAQTLIAVFTVSGVTPANIDFAEAAYTGGMAALLSVLTSIVSSGIGRTAGPSLTTEELAPPEPDVPYGRHAA
jgi:hypothetical protein